MFITDTVDAIYSPDEWRPDALLDKVADIANNLPLHRVTVSVGLHFSLGSCLNHYQGTQSPQVIEQQLDIGSRSRRPQLYGIRKVLSVADLGPFLTNASLANYEDLYATRGNIDWDLINKDILRDIFTQH